jgi:carotenoid cleavage dioxygenase
MMHGVRLRDGAASYRNRYVHTAARETDRRAGRWLGPSLMERPDLAEVAAGRMPYRNTGNTSLVVHHGRALALCDFGTPHEIILPTLATRGLYAIDGEPGEPCASHPQIDPVTGELLFLRYRLGQRPFVTYGVLDRDGRLVHRTGIDTERPGMMHSFALTTHHVVVFEQPLYFDADRAHSGRSGWVYDAALPLRIGVLGRRAPGDQVRWYTAASACVPHLLNAWEAGGDVVIIGMRFPQLPDALRFDPPAAGEPLNGDAAVLHAWRIELATGLVREQALGRTPGEWPRMNDGFIGRPTRYAYHASHGPESAVVKYDLTTATETRHAHGPGRYGGEAVFVPRFDTGAEDDGYLLTHVWDARVNRSELVVLDALRPEAPPLARVHLPVRVPAGFHGTWIDGSVLDALRTHDSADRPVEASEAAHD